MLRGRLLRRPDSSDRDRLFLISETFHSLNGFRRVCDVEGHVVVTRGVDGRGRERGRDGQLG